MKTIFRKNRSAEKALYRPVLAAVAISFTFFTCQAQDANDLKLKDYRPVSIYKIPVTNVTRAKYPAIDMHTHVYGKNDQSIAQWIKAMDACGVEKAIVFTGAAGPRFDTLVKMYSKYGDRFELWCGFDYTGYDQPGYGPAAVRELERCFRSGAKGVGEVMFKGKGIAPSAKTRGIMLPDDPRMDPLFEKCAELRLPVNLHISEDKWMYERMDSTNDGLMNASKWEVRIENGAKTHEEMLERLENTLKKHPRTIFVAAHLANCCADLSVLADYFDKYPNLYADISARFGEIAPIPKFVHDFIEKYQDRIVYGTDMSFSERIYRITFRILETADEHFYEINTFGYHWPLYGLFLSDKALKKVYRDNALKIINRQ
ncbi:MAG: amidohydrolase family protein [Bacteroidales bacterium]|nr:amidohydrolase family protein [Bacteroidales bacterium]